MFIFSKFCFQILVMIYPVNLFVFFPVFEFIHKPEREKVSLKRICGAPLKTDVFK